jgi:uncharacterized protein (DUF2141 family)
MVMKVANSQARCDFEGIPSGTYALVVLHDENMNGKLDTNWLGVPKEGYGFSNDPDAATAPSAKDRSDAASALAHRQIHKNGATYARNLGDVA